MKERGESYGDFADLAATAQMFKTWFRGCPSWDKMTHAQRETLDMNASKQARLLHGDPMHMDSWLDQIGYLELVMRDLTKP